VIDSLFLSFDNRIQEEDVASSRIRESIVLLLKTVGACYFLFLACTGLPPLGLAVFKTDGLGHFPPVCITLSAEKRGRFLKSCGIVGTLKLRGLFNHSIFSS
jgi:hypothetical protein